MDEIVFASGSFDILHIGHIRFLEQAKALGDRLLVGVEDDNWIRDIKHHEPYMPLFQRMHIVQSLHMVDWTIPVYGPRRPQELQGWNVSIRAIGEDHDKVWPEEAQGIEDKFEAAGIKYVHLPATPNISSTMFRGQLAEDTRPCDYFVVGSSSLKKETDKLMRILWGEGLSCASPSEIRMPEMLSPAEYKKMVIGIIRRCKKAIIYWDGVSHGPLVDLGICLGAGVEVEQFEIIPVSKADTYIQELARE